MFDSNDFNGRNLKEKTNNSDPKYSIFLLSMPDLGKFWGFKWQFRLFNKAKLATMIQTGRDYWCRNQQLDFFIGATESDFNFKMLITS